MFLPELVRFLSWTSAKFLPALDSSGKRSNDGCFVMILTICPGTRPTDGSWILLWIYYGLAWAHSTLVLNKCQYFTGSQQFRKNIKPRLLSDDTNNLVPRFRQLMTTRILLWICQYSTNANHFLSQSLTAAWLIFSSGSIPNLSLTTGPVLSRDLFYAWASPEYRDSLTSTGSRLRRLSKIGIRLAFLHGYSQLFGGCITSGRIGHIHFKLQEEAHYRAAPYECEGPIRMRLKNC